MDEQEVQVRRVGRRRSRAEAQQVVAAYEASGLRQIEFCRLEELSLATLSRYRKRERDAHAEAAAGNAWVAVEVSSGSAADENETASGLAVALSGGRRIEVRCRFDAQTLVQLLGVLERR